MLFKRKTIRLPRSIGQIIKECREKKGIPLSQAERETEIRLKYLKALEEDHYDDFPAEVYSLGFLARYSNYLGLESQELIHRYKIDYEIFKNLQKRNLANKKNKEDKVFLCSDPRNFNRKTFISLSSQVLISLAVSLFVIGLMGYIWFQVKSFAAAPRLEINNPASEITVSLESILVEGKTDSGASLFINNQPVSIDSNGYFKQEIKLVFGLNTIELVARNKADKETKKIIQVLAKQ